MQIKVNYSIILVSDMQCSITFYRDIVGIPLKFESPGWTGFATGGATLALYATETRPVKSESSDIAGQCRAGFQVFNIEEFHLRMKHNKVPCAQESKETFGVKIAQHVEPNQAKSYVSADKNCNPSLWTLSHRRERSGTRLRVPSIPPLRSPDDKTTSPRNFQT